MPLAHRSQSANESGTEIEIDRLNVLMSPNTITMHCNIDIIVHIKINTHINANSNLITNLYQNIIRYECVAWIEST